MRLRITPATAGRNVIVLLFLFFGTGLCAQFGAADQFLVKGINAQKDDNLADAIDSYTLALQHNPQQTEVLYHRSTAYRRTGKINLAVADLNRLLHIDPLNLRALEYRAQIYFDCNRHEEALADYQAVIRLQESAKGHLNVGLVYLAMKKPDLALQEFRLAKQQNPYLSAVYGSIGDAFAAKGKQYNEQAFHYWDEALEMNPADICVLKSRGKHHLYLGDSEKAMEDFITLLSYAPDSEAHLYLAQCYFEFGNAEKADTHINYAVGLDHSNPEIYFSMGLMAKAAGKMSKALEYFYVAKGYNSQNPVYIREIGCTQYALRQPYEALHTLLDYEKTEGTDTEIEYIIQECYRMIEEAGDPQSATDSDILVAPSANPDGFAEDIFDK